MKEVTHDTPELSGLKGYSFTLLNRAFQAVIEVERAALERDKLSLITPRIQQLAGEAARHPGELLWKLFESNPNAYDGTAFFADTRVIGDSANIDNILTGTGTSVAQFQADLNSARAAMRKFQDDRGRPLNTVGNTIIIPPELELVAFQATNIGTAGPLDRAVLPASTNGIVTGSGYTIITNSYLTDANDWYLLHVGGPGMRPFIHQTEKAVTVESDTNPMTRENIIKRNFIYSVYGRYNVGVTDPRLAVKVTNT
jgi:phage major head subunit gpT-like protein